VAKAPEEKIVEIFELTKIFRDFWHKPKVVAVDRLTLSIRRGEVFGLLGPNGSGKSTTIKILLGLLFPTSGKVSVFGRPVRDVKVKSRIGYLPEETNLYRFLDAEETLDFYGRIFNFTSKERRWRIDNLLELVGLSKERKRPLSEYSKGMSRRIGIAQALINDPDLIIMDEPTTGLDPIGRREVKNLILELKKRGKTVLLSNHLLAEVEEVCDRIGVLFGGKLLAEGSVKNLLTRSDLTQITVPALEQATTEKILSFISQSQSDKDVIVQSSRQSLETFFLNVVQKARDEKLAFSGAEAGISAEGLMRAGPTLEKGQIESGVISKLMKRPVKEKGVQPEAAPEQVAEIKEQIERKKTILSKLTEDKKPVPEETPELKQKRQMVKEAQLKRKKIIDRLSKKEDTPSSESGE